MGARRRGHRHGQPPRRPPRRGPSSCTRPALRSVTTPVDLALQHLSPPSPSVSTLLRQTVVCPSHSAAGSSPAHKASGFSPTPTDEPEPNTGDALLRARRGWACRSVVVRDAPRTRPALRLAPRPAPPAPHAVLQVSHVPSTRCRVLWGGHQLRSLRHGDARRAAEGAAGPRRGPHRGLHRGTARRVISKERWEGARYRASRSVGQARRSRRRTVTSTTRSLFQHASGRAAPSNVSRCNHSGHPRAEPPSQSGIAYRTRSCRRWGKSLCVSE